MNSTTHCSRSRHQAAAFTLADLLAVLSVLAIGVALLTPALARTQPNSPAFQCFNNLRQLSHAWLIYADDNADKLPHPNWNPPFVPGWLYDPSAASAPPDLLVAPYAANPVLAYQGGLLWSYVNQMSTYRCALDNANTTHWKYRKNKLSTYLMNGAVCGYGIISYGNTYKLTDFRQDAFIMWEPDDISPSLGMNNYNDASSYPDPSSDFGLGQRHTKAKGIAATAGGGVEFVKYADWVKASKDPNKNRVWCSPGSANGH